MLPRYFHYIGPSAAFEDEDEYEVPLAAFER
jgi:hypothetical protein